MNLTIKNEEKISILKITELSLIVFSLMILFVSMNNNGKNIISIFAQSEEEDKDSSFKKSEAKDNNNDLTIITVQIDQNNVRDSEDNDNLLKVVGYLNGEGQTKYVDLKEIDKKIINQNEKFLKVDLKFNKSNDISSTMVDDEYYVCAYIMENNNRTEEDLTVSFIPLYDCDEGNIGTSTTKDSVTLFSTMKKYDESKAFYTANQNTTANSSNPTKEVKITINVPVSDAKDIDDMNVVAMVKGEYQIKTFDVQND
jgi:hypothetical protein